MDGSEKPPPTDEGSGAKETGTKRSNPPENNDAKRPKIMAKNPVSDDSVPEPAKKTRKKSKLPAKILNEFESLKNNRAEGGQDKLSVTSEVANLRMCKKTDGQIKIIRQISESRLQDQGKEELSSSGLSSFFVRGSDMKGSLEGGVGTSGSRNSDNPRLANVIHNRGNFISNDFGKSGLVSGDSRGDLRPKPRTSRYLNLMKSQTLSSEGQNPYMDVIKGQAEDDPGTVDFCHFLRQVP